MPRTIRQTVTIDAAPKEIYQALMDSRKHSAFTGEKASISRRVGGKFTAYGDYIEGKNLELVPNKKIVQAWRGSDWPEGHYSRTTIALKAVKGATRLMFTQSGVPDEQYKSISQGWKDFYWKPLAKYFGKR